MEDSIDHHSKFEATYILNNQNSSQISNEFKAIRRPTKFKLSRQTM